MTGLFGLVGAIAATFTLLVLFAVLRRVMRQSTPPLFLNSSVVAFAMSLGMTLMALLSLMYLGSNLLPLIESVALSAVLAIALHVLLWSVARLLVPIGAGNLATDIAAATKLVVGGDALPAH